MRVVDRGQLARFLSKFNRWADLEAVDVDDLLALSWQMATFGRGSVIEPVPRRIPCSTVIVEGMVASYLSPHRCAGQIAALHLPGDMACPRDTFLGYEATHLAAITDVVTAMVPQRDLVALARTRPTIGLGLWRQSLTDSNVMRRWLFNMTQLSALQRLAHFLCEMVVRQEEAGLTTEPKYPLPLSQNQMADVLGMTSVHVNRMLRELRLLELVDVDRRTMRIIDWIGLRNLCSYDPKYLGASPSGADAKVPA